MQQNISSKDTAFRGIIGVSTADITPPVGIYAGNWCAATFDTTEGVHRPLELGCVTFQMEASQEALVLLSADLGWWKNPEDEWWLRKGILEALSLAPGNLMLCLSHTHAGPSIFRGSADKPGGDLIAPYLTQVRQSAIALVKKALASAAPALLTWHYGSSDLASNRDLPGAYDQIAVGYNPDLPADDTLLVGRISRIDGTVLATIVNYACHPTTLGWDNRLISPDYVGAMRALVTSVTNAPCFFLQGASGELAPREQYVGEPAIADRHGRQLGYAVLATLEGMDAPGMALSLAGIVESGASLAVWKPQPAQISTHLQAEMTSVPLPLKKLLSLKEIDRQYLNCTDRVARERLLRARAIRKAVGNEAVVGIPLWVWRLGDSFIIGQPNEAYSDFQRRLRCACAPRSAAVMNIVNGSMGYLPPRDCYHRNLYQVWQSPFAAGSLELLIETAEALIGRLSEKG